MKKTDNDSKEIFEKYHETFYKDLHGWRDYELTSKGYGEWYYDCLPVEKNARILDIGCGDGKFISFLQRKGYTGVEGMELSSQQAEEARKNVKCPIHEVDDAAPFLREKTNTYQMITMNDVLEHVPKQETVSFLKSIHGAINPGGVLVVNVPQVSGLTSIFYRYNDFTHQTLFYRNVSKTSIIFSRVLQRKIHSTEMALKMDSPSSDIQICTSIMVSHIEIDLHNRVTWRKTSE